MQIPADMSTLSKPHAIFRTATLGILTSLAALTLSAQDAPAFSFAKLQERAAALAASPYQAAPSRVPESLRRLSYDQYREIEYKASRAFWADAGLPFRLQFFHPGFIQVHTVRINEVDGGEARPIPFSSGLFNYRAAEKQLGSTDFPADMGFSGLRVHNPLNSPGKWDDLIVFQGASYFRALAKGAHYGLSARGLALNTAEPGGEEFPVFEEFWIERPAPAAKSLRIWALMNSASVTGAYQFLIAPGAVTVIDVDAVIYRRASTADAGGKRLVFGIAPLTSMFWFGESSAAHPDDLRPAVHDSDGLLLHTGKGEWLWRPLDNPRSVRVSSFSDEHPKGFGLMQRARDFADYQDIEAAYHLRPSVWIEPLGDWGRGAVRLVELPTPDETNDNIVAFWTPAAPPPAGEPLRVAYRMHWFADAGDSVLALRGGIVVATRQGRTFTHETDLRRFWIDYAGDALAKLPADARVEAVVTAGAGAEIAHVSAQKNPFDNSWRAAFAIKPDGSGAPVELRCFLRNDRHEALTETWSYLWNPPTQ